MEVIVVRNGRVGFSLLSNLELALIETDPIMAMTVPDEHWPPMTPIPATAISLARCPIVYIDLPTTMMLFDNAVLVIVCKGASTTVGVVGVPAVMKTNHDALRCAEGLLSREPELLEAILNKTAIRPSEYHDGASAVASGVSVACLKGYLILPY